MNGQKKNTEKKIEREDITYNLQFDKINNVNAPYSNKLQ